MIALIQLIVREMSVALCDLDAGMTRQFLCQFEIARGAQDGGHEIVAEGVRRYATFGLVAERLADAFADNIPSCCRCDGLDLLPGALVVAGEEGQGGEGASGAAIENGAIGAKLTGAGGGGYLMLFCEKPNQRAVRDALSAQGLKQMDFKFDMHGAKIIGGD